MNNKVIVTCPVCNNNLHVERLVCPCCHTKIEGDFELSIFDTLSVDKQDFILIFLKNGGNIKAIEKELNISYPTVKRMLEEVLTALHINSKVDIHEETLTKEEILAQLKNGQIDFETASKLIKESEDEKND